MGIVEDLADGLAKDAIDVAEALGDPTVLEKISKLLGDTSTTTQEAYLTAVRVRLAEQRARKYIQGLQVQAAKSTKARVDLSDQKIMNATDDGAVGH